MVCLKNLPICNQNANVANPTLPAKSAPHFTFFSENGVLSAQEADVHKPVDNFWPEKDSNPFFCDTCFINLRFKITKANHGKFGIKYSKKGR